jgi:hypothetical protein
MRRCRSLAEQSVCLFAIAQDALSQHLPGQRGSRLWTRRVRPFIIILFVFAFSRSAAAAFRSSSTHSLDRAGVASDCGRRRTIVAALVATESLSFCLVLVLVRPQSAAALFWRRGRRARGLHARLVSIAGASSRHSFHRRICDRALASARTTARVALFELFVVFTVAVTTAAHATSVPIECKIGLEHCTVSAASVAITSPIAIASATTFGACCASSCQSHYIAQRSVCVLVFFFVRLLVVFLVIVSSSTARHDASSQRVFCCLLDVVFVATIRHSDSADPNYISWHESRLIAIVIIVIIVVIAPISEAIARAAAAQIGIYGANSDPQRRRVTAIIRRFLELMPIHRVAVAAVFRPYISFWILPNTKSLRFIG